LDSGKKKKKTERATSGRALRQATKSQAGRQCNSKLKMQNLKWGEDLTGFYPIANAHRLRI
jgi:hypothetical protein